MKYGTGGNPEAFGSAPVPEAPTPPSEDLLYEAWGVIANVSEGDWAKQPQEWQDAARRWRDRWHEHLEGGDDG